MKRVVAVIGASGFVGSAVTEHLLEKGDGQVVPIIHSSGNAWRLARRGLPLATADLLERKDLEKALHGCTHVVNCSRGSDDVMIGGLKNLLSVCHDYKIRRLVHLSSVAVYGDPPPPESTHESAPTTPTKGTYGWMKLQQDNMVAKAAKQGLPATILCPPNISGPGSIYLAQLIDSLKRGAFAYVDGGHTPCNLVDVLNLAHAVDLSLDHGQADGHRLFITDGEATTWRDLIDCLMPLAGIQDAPPTIDRDILATMSRKSEAPSRSSLIRSIKHLISGDMRDVLRRDPLWLSVDRAARSAVARLGTSVENRLRLLVEGPIRISIVDDRPSLDIRLCAQQLRTVRHSCDKAVTELGYHPLVTFKESMDAFERCFNTMHGRNSEFADLLG